MLRIILQQVPVKTPLFAPLAPLAKFATHEKKDLTRVRPLVGIKQAQIGEFLPQVARHLVEHALLEVDDLVMRKRHEKYLTTVGVVVSRRMLVREHDSINLLIWDLAGGRDFSHTGYLIGVSGALLVCDLTRYETLAAYRAYAEQVRAINPRVAIILIANKSDLEDQRSIGTRSSCCRPNSRWPMKGSAIC